MMKTNRRSFLKTVGVAGAAVALPGRLGAEQARRRPNVLVIITDQQSATMMSCAGNKHLKTPAMDSLAAAGVRFERAYPSNPVCLPARFSFFTGRMPSAVAIGLNADGRKGVPKDMPPQAMGWLFRKAGYQTVYGGKVHLPRGMGLEQIGFRRLTGDTRGKLADQCAAFLKQAHEKPFLLVASFMNPHDICYMAINDHRRSGGQAPLGNLDSRICEGLIAGPRKKLKEFAEKHCPPLPANHAVPGLEPEAITTSYVKRRMFRHYARTKWPPEMWRLHRWAYCRLTEKADAHISKVLDAVRQANLQDSTLIVFTSDHGDHDSAHKLEHKSILYEGAARIPFLISYKGVIPAGRVDDEHLVSSGLDLLPTLCDYAGIEPPRGLLGRSVRPLAEKKPPASWRDYLVVESHSGRMLRTASFKYVVYSSGARREQLIDLKDDPGEMKNLAYDQKHKDVLAKHRELLGKWFKRAADSTAGKYIV